MPTYLNYRINGDESLPWPALSSGLGVDVTIARTAMERWLMPLLPRAGTINVP